jgi:hypothetical protein
MTQIDLRLTKEEAIVLFEMLSRFSENDSLEIEDQSEQRVLWNLCASLEAVLVEPFDKNYASILENARAMLRDNTSG